MKKSKVKSSNCLYKKVFCCCKPEIQHDEVLMVYQHIISGNVCFVNGNVNRTMNEQKINKNCLDLGYSMMLGKHCQLYGRNYDVEQMVSLIINECIKYL